MQNEIKELASLCRKIDEDIRTAVHKEFRDGVLLTLHQIQTTVLCYML